MPAIEIKPGIWWVGVNVRSQDLFEGLWPIPDGVSLNTRVDGPEGAPWVVLSNSLGSNLSMWDGQVPMLTRKYRVLRYDHRGHGQSDVPPGPYTFDRLTADVIGLMEMENHSSDDALQDLVTGLNASAGAGTYAKDGLKNINDAWAAMQDEVKKQEGKLFKNYDNAKAMIAKITSDAAAGRLTVEAGRSTFSLATLPREDFPVMASSEYTANFSAPAPVLRRGIG